MFILLLLVLDFSVEFLCDVTYLLVVRSCAYFNEVVNDACLYIDDRVQRLPCYLLNYIEMNEHHMFSISYIAVRMSLELVFNSESH
jgi:hypothetical protein